MSKKHVKPQLTAIELDHRQAILQVCKAGGLYMSGDFRDGCYYDRTGGDTGDRACLIAVRGETDARTESVTTQRSTAPS